MYTFDTQKVLSQAQTELKAVKYCIYSREQAFRHMTRRRSNAEQLLYMIVDEVLFNVWDPLTLSLHQECREAYYPYLPHVFDLLIVTENGGEICEYLTFVEQTLMGTVKGDTLAKRRAGRVVEILMESWAALLHQPRQINNAQA